jgi:hypothetical protein
MEFREPTLKGSRGIISSRSQMSATLWAILTLAIFGHPVTGFTFQPTGDAATKFVVRDVKNHRFWKRKSNFLHGSIQCFSLRNGTGKAIQHPATALGFHPIKHARQHNIVRHILASV